ncbi:MAG TPA: hypothetical protein PKC18_16355, partial [Lacipirellulaceae bacterium]|nr:hypothetical protein [Lacipirellulaceae bacterium]
RIGLPPRTTLKKILSDSEPTPQIILVFSGNAGVGRSRIGVFGRGWGSGTGAPIGAKLARRHAAVPPRCSNGPAAPPGGCVYDAEANLARLNGGRVT